MEDMEQFQRDLTKIFSEAFQNADGVFDEEVAGQVINELNQRDIWSLLCDPTLTTEQVIAESTRRGAVLHWGTFPDEYDPAKDPDHSANSGNPRLDEPGPAW